MWAIDSDFFENPIAIQMETADQINRVIQENGIIASVGYHWRYQDNADHARSVLVGQKIVGALGYWMGECLVSIGGE